MTIGIPSTWEAPPSKRCEALLDASRALQAEHTNQDSPLYQRLNVEARAVMGYSLGGGGAQLAALKDSTLKCIVALCPHDGREFDGPFPDQLSSSVPVLIVCSEKDTLAKPKDQAWAQYNKTSAPKLIFEISKGDHYSANGPSGGTESDFNAGAEPCVLCNYLLMSCCNFAPCPHGEFNGGSGFAKEEAPRGAIGGVVLAWLQLFLLGEEGARVVLGERPEIACGFESERMER